ncbi:MAG: LytTR family transcriptional regulator DNA-binding domain-containing protein [Thermoanaerobaculia bacterium]|nr:LytTR family transcriptional regulator DNA-binding domain-containing protein [Thermoanaerobaculia bacterium]
MKSTQSTARESATVHMFSADQQPPPQRIADAIAACRQVQELELHRLGLSQFNIWPTGIRVLYAPKRSKEKIASFVARYDEVDHSPLIFLSDSDEFAVSAFAAGAADYLVTPLLASRIEAAMARALELARPAEQLVQGLLKSLQSALSKSTPTNEVIVCRTTNMVQMIPVSEVRWIEGDRNYFKLHTDTGAVRKRGSLTRLERRLPSQFHRVHRSAIVNMEKVVRIVRFPNATGQAVLDDGSKVPISRGRRLHRERPVLDLA